MCHTLWHRLDLDFVSDESNTGRLSAYTGGRCLSVDRRTRPSCAALGPAGDVLVPDQLRSTLVMHSEKLQAAEQFASGLGGFWHSDRRAIAMTNLTCPSPIDPTSSA